MLRRLPGSPKGHAVLDAAGNPRPSERAPNEGDYELLEVEWVWAHGHHR